VIGLNKNKNKNKHKIMDVRSIDTRCIPETILLCIERIAYILRRWLGFWFSYIYVPMMVELVVFQTLIAIQNTAHLLRYILRTFIEECLIDFERRLAKRIQVVCQ
jgi:hypothetical protein